MMTKSTGPLLKIDDVSQSLINFTKLYQDPDSLSVKPDCYYREQSFISQCLADIRRTLAATECSLHWCINHYFARQESGVLEESVTDSWWSHLGTDIVTVMEPGDEDGIGMTLGDHIQLLPPKEEVNSSENGQKLGRDDTNPAQGNISTRRPASYDPCFIWIYANHVLVDWLDKFFIRELTSIDTTGFNSLDSDTDDVAIVSGQNKRPSGEISGAHQPDPVFDMFSNVAFGLTQFIRRDRHSLTGTEKANGHSVEVDGEIYKLKFTAPGTVFEDRTVVQVRWAWLCFPVGLVAMTVFLTIATKIRSSKQQIPIWGSSTTALMIRGPYSHTNEISPLSLSADQMHQKAKSTKVTLERSTDGSWRLVERRDAAIRDEATDLESAVSFLPHSTTQEMREHPNPTGTSTEMATESLLAASGTRGGEATVTAWNPRQKPRAGRSQSF
ncbi:MAG: hypothetical protein LQ337_006427 [Flavoplaca oasis]|nr:MAG: hypothetical protein LQ337_006427 [Flavoplaca oasis]